jgi:pimeloyl-ACP methyl ester carboxylesterase
MDARYDTIRFRGETIDGVGVHVQEAGDPRRSTLALLHVFPSSSRMWERLIPTPASHDHVVAPDDPGFGRSDAPTPDAFDSTFDHLANVVSALLERLGVGRYRLSIESWG